LTKIIEAVKIPGQSGVYWVKTIAQLLVVGAGFLGIEMDMEEAMTAAVGVEAIYLIFRKFRSNS